MMAGPSSFGFLNSRLWIVCIVCCLGLIYAGEAPKFKISLTLRSVPLDEALRRVAARLVIDLVYADALVEGVTVSCDLRNASLETVFETLLMHAPVTYRRVDDQRIVLVAREERSLMALKGRVTTSEATPIPGASVQLVDSSRGFITGPDGTYLLKGLPRDTYRMTVTAVGYLPRELEISETDGERGLDVALLQMPRVMQNLRVTFDRNVPILPERPEGAMVLLPKVVVEKQGDLARDLFQSLDLLPGVEAGGVGETGVSVRGSTPTENLMILDGIKLYQMDHALGYYSAVSSDAVEEIRVFKSGIPARYGGRVAGIFDISTPDTPIRKPAFRFGLSRDIGQATVETPLWSGGGILVSTRKSLDEQTAESIYDRVFQRTFNDEQQRFDEYEEIQHDLGLSFSDWTTKLSHWTDSGDLFSLTYFESGDNTSENINYVESLFVLPLYERLGEWGNTGLGLRWVRRFSERLEVELSSSWSRFDSEFRFFSGLEGGAGDVFIHNSNTLKDHTTGLEARWYGARHTLVAGASFSDLDSSFEEQDTRLDDYRTAWDSREQAFYLQDRVRLAKWLEASFGFRLQQDELSDSQNLDPRIALTANMSERFSARLAWDHQHQYLMRSSDTVNYFYGSDTWFHSGEDLFPGVSKQLELNLQYRGDHWRLDFELFDKKQSGSLRRLYYPDVGFPENLQTKDEIRGLELSLQGAQGPWFWQATYGYRRARVVRDLHTGEALDYPTDRDTPHRMKLVGNFTQGHWVVSATWDYASGRPYGIPSVGRDEFGFLELYHPEEPNALRLPANHQLDMSLRYRFNIKRAQIELGLTLRNLYDRDNILYRYFVLDEEESGIFPVDVPGFEFKPAVDLRVAF